MNIRSVCTYCGVGCDINATVENNQIVKINGNENGTVSRGKLCIKGKEGYGFVDSVNRLNNIKIKKSFIEQNKELFKNAESKLIKLDDTWFTCDDYELIYEVIANKIKNLTKDNDNKDIFACIGGARTSCENAFVFQKFTREVLGSANVDCCARVCHSPSLAGMKPTIGEGASTSDFDDVENSENVILIGSNITSAHPIASHRLLNAIKNGTKLTVIDVKEIDISKNATNNCIIPYEANLLTLNMIAYEILSKELYNKEFIEQRVSGFDKYKKNILNDKYANPKFYQNISGYEHLCDMIPKIAQEYASNRSKIMWGLGVTEHIDGSFAVMAMVNLALMTGNFGLAGTGLMPMRGQNNVQGACDMGCLPYFAPDYQPVNKVGLMTPDMLDFMLEDKIKILFNMGEDLLHIHPNLNKVKRAIEKLDLIVVNELIENEISKEAHIVFGVKSAYEKSGVYINAERRLHLSQPLIESNRVDDWEIYQGISKHFDNKLEYKDHKEIWSEVQKEAPNRFSGASIEKLRKNQIQGMQWPIGETDTKILHKDNFRTVDGLGNLIYNSYELRGMIKDILENKDISFYLTTGRTLAQYNNAIQTKQNSTLNRRYSEDILLVSVEDKKIFEKVSSVKLRSKYGESARLKIKISNRIKKGTMFTTFHFPESKINYLFGDECDVLVKTARFKSVKVEIIK
jgi:formate dehydrogenase major subunit